MQSKNESEVYQPEGLSEQIFKERYTAYPEETWREASLRLASHVAHAEPDKLKQVYTEEFYEEIVTNRFMPGGRIWYGAGRTRAQLLNCFVIPTSDSREGWGQTVSDTIVISGMGGGIGINCSPIRPRGSRINGTGGIATGAVSLMEMVNGVGNVIVGGGGRRVALMLDLNITHPDMPEFIDRKLNKDELNNANVSVIIDKRLNTETLIKKIRARESFDLTYRQSTYGSVNAYDLWQKIVSNAHTSGEPGVLNGDLANRESNIFYYKPLISTNPCGEIWLEEYGCCDLGALVLPRFVNSFGILDTDALRSTIRTAVRFLDNVLSVNEYPLPAIRDNCNNLRRIGLGIMGLHDMLMKMGYKYSSPEARSIVNELMEFIKIAAYQASIDLAKEKGPFAVYQDDFLNSGYVQRALPSGITDQIKEFGIRNCALLTIAPNGTTGMVTNTSTGIEPIFAPAYWRRFYRPTPDGSRQLDRELVINPWWDQLASENKSLDVLEGAYDITPEQHLAMQEVCQSHIDNAVSKTINLPENLSVDSLSDLWLEYLPRVKGTTFYRAGSRGQEPLEALSLQEALILRRERHAEAEAIITEQNSMDCVGDSCEIPEHLKPAIQEQLTPEMQISFV